MHSGRIVSTIVTGDVAMSNIVKLPSSPQAKPKLLDQVRNEIRMRHYSPRTEEAYVGWILRYIRFHGIRHPAEMGKDEIEAFLSHLAVKKHVAESTQNQAFNALLFLYREVLRLDVAWLDSVVRANKPKRLPVVLTRAEVRNIMEYLHDVEWLCVMLLYGAGLRLLECLRLRIKDVDFGYRQILVRQGKGNKDRITILPAVAETRLMEHITRVKQRFEADLNSREIHVKLPGAFHRKSPEASREWVWQWVFPATRTYVDRTTGLIFRHHLNETLIQKAIRRATARSKIPKRITPAIPSATALQPLLEDGYDIRTVQELLGHRDVSTTMMYTHVLNRGGRGVKVRQILSDVLLKNPSFFAAYPSKVIGRLPGRLSQFTLSPLNRQ